MGETCGKMYPYCTCVDSAKPFKVETSAGTIRLKCKNIGFDADFQPRNCRSSSGTSINFIPAVDDLCLIPEVTLKCPVKCSFPACAPQTRGPEPFGNGCGSVGWPPCSIM